MLPNHESGNLDTRIIKDPYIAMEEIVRAKFPSLPAEKVGSFIGDFLTANGIDSGFVLHRYDSDKQGDLLMGILDNPFDKEEINSLLDTVPDSLKQFYGIDTSN